MSNVQHTPWSIAALAVEAQMMPWEKDITDVPHSARYAFRQAITADHYIELLATLRELHEATSAPFPPAEAGMQAQTAWAERKAAAHVVALQVIAKATGSAS